MLSFWAGCVNFAHHRHTPIRVRAHQMGEEKRAEIRAAKPKVTAAELTALVKKLELNPVQCSFSNKTDWTLRKVYEEDCRR